MGLAEKIREIARQEGIPESELILDELEWFMKEHEGHGDCDIILAYNPELGKANTIYLKCLGNNLICEMDCPHNGIGTINGLDYSIIYQKEIDPDAEIQKERREGRIDYKGRQIIKFPKNIGYS